MWGPTKELINTHENQEGSSSRLRLNDLPLLPPHYHPVPKGLWCCHAAGRWDQPLLLHGNCEEHSALGQHRTPRPSNIYYVSEQRSSWGSSGEAHTTQSSPIRPAGMKPERGGQLLDCLSLLHGNQCLFLYMAFRAHFNQSRGFSLFLGHLNALSTTL